MNVTYTASSPEAQGRIMSRMSEAGYTVHSGGDWASRPTTVSVEGVAEADRDALIAMILTVDPDARAV